MNRPELYKKTVDILLDAYNNGDLVHGLCSHCAVGNIVRANNPHIRKPEMIIDLFGMEGLWYRLKDFPGYVKGDGSALLDAAIDQIDSTGYSVEEIFQIEEAFEGDKPEEPQVLRRVTANKEEQFKGLTRVLKVLEEIHAGEEPKSQERLKKIAKEKYLVEV